MSIRPTLESRLASLAPAHVRLVDESHMHSVPPGAESHWNLVIVSPSFDGQSLLARQRAVWAALGDDVRKRLHALTMKTMTPAEWQAAGGLVENVSPPCLGGSKAG